MSGFAKTELEIAGMMGISPEEYNRARLEEARTAEINSMLTPDEMKACNAVGADPLDFLKETGRFNINHLLSQNEIATCRALNVDPVDFYFAKKYK